MRLKTLKDLKKNYEELLKRQLSSCKKDRIKEHLININKELKHEHTKKNTRNK